MRALTFNNKPYFCTYVNIQADTGCWWTCIHTRIYTRCISASNELKYLIRAGVWSVQLIRKMEWEGSFVTDTVEDGLQSMICKIKWFTEGMPSGSGLTYMYMYLTTPLNKEQLPYVYVCMIKCTALWSSPPPLPYIIASGHYCIWPGTMIVKIMYTYIL